MASLVGLVNPAQGAGPTFQDVLERTAAKGEDAKLPGVMAERLLGLPNRDFPMKQLRAEGVDCADKRTRRFAVLVNEDGSQGDNVWISASLVWPGNKETFDFLTSTDGELLRASRLRGKIDSSGAGVAGSGDISSLDVDSPDVKARFQKELDFWVKGKGRKKGKAASGPADKTKDKQATATRG